MDARQLQERLEGAFPEASIRVDGGAGRFELGLVSSEFEGLNRVKRQQLVYRVWGCHRLRRGPRRDHYCANPEEAGA